MHTVDDFDAAADPRPVVDPDATETERNYAQWIHLAGLIGGAIAVFSAGVSQPFALIAVLILWLVKRDESPFIDDHGKEATNFQISILIYALLAIPVAFVLGFVTCGAAWVLIPLAIVILAIVGTLKGSQAAARGEFYRYPACIRLIG